MKTQKVNSNMKQATKTATHTAQSLILCFFQTKAPSTSVLNRKATSRVLVEASAQTNAARVYNTVLTAKGTAVGKAISIQQQTRCAIQMLGAPCRTGGNYIRIKRINEVQNIFDDAQYELNLAKQDIIATYDTVIVALTDRLGKMANEVDIPTAQEIANKFTMSLTFINQPIAICDDALNGLAEEVANKVRAESMAQIDDLLKQAHQGPLIDLKDTLTEFIDRMKNAKRLHMSQFEKLRGHANRVADLNLSDSPEITSLAKEVLALSEEGGDHIDDNDRKRAAATAESIVTQVSSTLTSLGL
jgi:hypothetical protein